MLKSDEVDKVDKDYLIKVSESCSDLTFPKKLHSNYDNTDMIIDLLVQNNLLLDKLCSIMLVAAGLDTSDVPNITNEDAKELVGKSVMCPECRNIVLPNALGYCPKCRSDLRAQFNKEAISG